MIIAYARCSTDEQNLDLQLTALKQHGYDRLFTDPGLSGLERRRPGLKKSLATLDYNDTLVVWRLDRLGRSVHHLSSIAEQLCAKGVTLMSLTDMINIYTASGKFTFHMLAAMAEYESDVISERTIAGMAEAKANGKHIGRPKVMPFNDPLSL